MSLNTNHKNVKACFLLDLSTLKRHVADSKHYKSTESFFCHSLRLESYCNEANCFSFRARFFLSLEASETFMTLKQLWRVSSFIPRMVGVAVVRATNRRIRVSIIPARKMSNQFCWEAGADLGRLFFCQRLWIKSKIEDHSRVTNYNDIAEWLKRPLTTVHIELSANAERHQLV